MPRYRMTVRFNAFKNRFESYGEKFGSDQKRLITGNDGMDLDFAGVEPSAGPVESTISLRD